MLKLKRMNDFEKATYHGFVIKNGFWYGIDTETGQYIATSGWECNGYVSIFFKNKDSWKREWIDIDEVDFQLENIPQINSKDKMSFPQWLEAYLGVTWEYFDNNYNGDNEYQEYDDYYYDGLPMFVRKYLRESKQKEV